MKLLFVKEAAANGLLRLVTNKGSLRALLADGSRSVQTARLIILAKVKVSVHLCYESHISSNISFFFLATDTISTVSEHGYDDRDRNRQAFSLPNPHVIAQSVNAAQRHGEFNRSLSNQAWFHLTFIVFRCTPC
jgi:hypothetical protein